jgi:uncharacterized membrane protein YqjE
VTTTPVPNGAAGGARHAAEPSVGELVSEVSAQLSTLVHSEIELAKLELRSTVKNAGAGVFMFVGALVIFGFSLTFGFIALAEGLVAAHVWRWLAYLIVFVALLALVGALVFLGVKKVKKVRAPERTLETSRDTVAYLKANTRRS